MMGGNRISLIRASFAPAGIDTLLVTGRINIRYLTGYTGDDATLAIGPDDAALFVYPLNAEQARLMTGDACRVIAIVDTFSTSFKAADLSLRGPRVGYDPESLTCAAFNRLTASFDTATFIPAAGLPESLRMIKTASELSSIERAQRITEQVWNDLHSILAEGVTEREIAAEIDHRFRLAGGEGSSFDTIVAFGANAALPHAVPTDTHLRRGDLVLVDMGTIVDGYASDMTRTLVFGHANNLVRERYRLVREAQEAGRDRVIAGSSCAESYTAARAVFEKAGVESLFIHSLGHGVGLEVHEMPRLSPRSTDIFQARSVVTVEPGLYEPGWGGIRIEDMVMVTDQGPQSITAVSTDLIEL